MIAVAAFASVLVHRVSMTVWLVTTRLFTFSHLY